MRLNLEASQSIFKGIAAPSKYLPSRYGHHRSLVEAQDKSAAES